MNADDLYILLTSYTLVVAFAAVADFVRRRQAVLLITVVVALVAVSATTVVGFRIKPEASYISHLWLLITERDFSAAVSMGTGVAAALVWVAQLVHPDHGREIDDRVGLIQRGFQPCLLAMSITGVVLGGQAFIWKELAGVTRDPASRTYAEEFVIEKIADIDYPPVRVAASDDGTAFVSYDYFETWGTMGGAIIQLSPDPATGKFQKKIVADSSLLMRSYGLAVRDGDLFVSRSGIHPCASMGKIVYRNTGAVTRLTDVDDDGYYEYAHDVVSGLPGARGPDTMQQNNGITFAPDGSLYITVGCSSNRELDEHPWGGVVLRVSKDFSQTEVFARGFRNPFGIVIGPDNQLFVTDNDVDENPGDELNHVVRGAHYGHPYIVPNEQSLADSGGFRDPILVGELESNFLGLAYATSPSLPEKYRHCLYITDLMENMVWRVTLVRNGDTYQVAGIFPFASVSTPVDIAVTPSGEFFVISRNPKNLYRIRPRKPVNEGGRG